MARKHMDSAEQVTAEIQRLTDSPYVKLARREQRLKVDRERQKLYTLRCLDKRGRELASLGVTLDNIEATMFSEEPEEGSN